MRVRLVTQHPLPPLKAWYPLPETTISEWGEKSPVIFDLKVTLIKALLRESEHSAQDISLLVDGFELLNESTWDVIKDGDLIA